MAPAVSATLSRPRKTQVKDFDASLYFNAKKSVRSNDRVTHFAVASTKLAIEDAGVDVEACGERCGVMVRREIDAKKGTGGEEDGWMLFGRGRGGRGGWKGGGRGVVGVCHDDVGMIRAFLCRGDPQS